VLMQEHAIYSVISPEGCAAILWRDASQAQKAASAFKPDAAHCLELGVIDGIVPEPAGGAHTDHDAAAQLLKETVVQTFGELEGVSTDELRRSRLTILFRLLLAIPHFVWITLWSLFVPFAALAAWVVALVAGRVPSALHRFLAAYVRYATHLFAYVYVVGSKFPGFTGRQGSYGIDVLIDGPRRQSRWKTFFRLFLALPAFFVASALGSVLFVVALFGWWFALIMGRMPEGLRNLGASCLRYSAQTYAYLLLLTDRYPYASPVLAGRQPMAEPLSVPLPEPVPGDAS